MHENHWWRRGPRPFLTFGLIAAMLVIYAVERIVFAWAGPGIYGVVFVQHPDYWIWPLFWTPFTNLVSHNVNDATHVVNLLFFVPLGWWTERHYSRGTFLLMYFGLGAVASTLQVEIQGLPANGSSSAIMVLAGLWFAHFQAARPWSSWHFISWSVPVTLLLLVVAPAVGRATVIGYDGIGHWSHLAGFVLGLGAFAVMAKSSARRATPPQ